MNIPGLPEGVECVRIGRATPEDFEIIANGDRHSIVKGLRQDSVSQVIVRPAPGWQFLPSILPSDLSAEYTAVQAFNPPVEVTILATRFLVTNSRDEQLVTDAAAALMTLPGYQAP